jgi:hypothetical protein
VVTDKTQTSTTGSAVTPSGNLATTHTTTSKTTVQ